MFTASDFIYTGAAHVEAVTTDDFDTPIDSPQLLLQQQQQQQAPPAPPAPAAGGAARGGGGLINRVHSFFAAPRAAPPAPRPAPRQRAKRAKHTRRQRFQQQVDTNLVTISLGTLKDVADIATGDAVFCTKCRAALSVISVLYDHEGKYIHGGNLKSSDEANSGDAESKTTSASAPQSKPLEAALIPAEATEGQQIWCCEFCNTVNLLDLDPAEFPTKKTHDYLLEPAPAQAVGRQASNDGSESSLIFCCDTSGSMCVTQEIQGQVNLRGNNNAPDLSQFIEQNQYGQQAQQAWPGQNQNVTYVSRMQAMQAAVADQMDQMAGAYPQKPCGFVTFNNDVSIVGDGTSPATIVAGDRLDDFAHLVQQGSSAPVNSGIASTRENLEKRLYDIQESGATALGPAMVVAVSAAAQKAGSKVILVTDGLANVGLGSLEGIENNEAGEAAANEFYTRVGMYAQEKGITIDVIGIEGTGCDVEHLGIMSEKSGGEVDKVKPMELAKNFASALATPVIATKAQVAMHLHAGLRFRNDENVQVQEISSQPASGAAEGVDTAGDDAAAQTVQEAKENGDTSSTEATTASTSDSVMVRDIGNVTEETDTNFEYTLQSPKILKASGFEKLTALPLQVQITYSRLDGSKYVRIITDAKRTTARMDEASAHADYSILANHAEQVTARMAKKGNYAESRAATRAWANFMSSNANTPQQRATTSALCSSMAECDQMLDDALEEEAQSASVASMSRVQLQRTRKTARSRNDRLSGMLSKKAKAKRSKYQRALVPVAEANDEGASKTA